MLNGSRQELFVGAFFAVSFAATTIVCGALAWREPTPLRLSASIGLALVTFSVPCLLPPLHRRGFPILAFRFLAVLNLLFLLPELSLRLAGFHYAPGIQFGWPRPEQFSSFVIDSDLFWRMDPAEEYVNSLGFPDDEVARPKPPGVKRLLFLGNSCLAQGIPQLALGRLRRLAPAQEFDDVVLAVPGYSSHQGLAAANLYGSDLAPDLVVVYFGWDDHWLARGPVDSERVVGTASSARSELYRKLRILQAVDRLLQRAAAGAVDDRSDITPGRYRVPIEDYEANLRGMVALFAEAGIPVLLITAPSSHAQLGVPRYFVDVQLIDDAQTAVRVHRQYNQVVRKVARSRGATLLDLEREFGELSDPAKMFTLDGIHFTEPGSQRVGNRIAKGAQALLSSSGS
jgi:lysophospholipase L1-like esterase